MKGFRRGVLVLLLAPALGGCQLFGALTQSVGSLLGVAISLAAIAIPFVLSYYLYRRN
ncbi:MAG TPA: hypothetical protein VJB14_12105 [Planctomycetota bacterium]|nr:hypothetical protein [Planctomycetota bacterium]